jgi:lysophospholipase L1-like esterase
LLLGQLEREELMKETKRIVIFTVVLFVVILTQGTSYAQLPWQFSQHTRYMVMGDSLGSGYGAIPQTRGYAYRLYKKNVIDRSVHTLLCNSSVIGVTSADVLTHQVPQAFVFKPDVVTLTVGGNDLGKILAGADPDLVLMEFQQNLASILHHLVIDLQATVYIANLYTVSDIPGADEVIPVFNMIVEGVANGFGVPVADLYGAFHDRKGLLLIERKGAEPYEMHPSNAGHRAIAKAFKAVIAPEKDCNF